jgi:hypothetical protein
MMDETGRITEKSGSDSSVPDMLHHLLLDEGGGLEKTWAGKTPMLVSEVTVEGALEPIHSTEQLTGGWPRTAGLVHISTDFNRIASIIRAVVIAVGAINRRFRRFLRVTTTFAPPVFEYRNV